MPRIWPFLFCAMVLALGVASVGEAREGFYIGLGGSYETINGEFDGSVGLLDGYRVIHLSEIDNAVGYDLRAGYQTSEPWAVEFDLMRTVHKGAWAGQPGDITHTRVSMSGKYSFRQRDAVQPFLLMGFSVNRLVIENGEADPFTGATMDSRLKGPGLDLGFGADTCLTRQVSLGLGFTYHFVEYSESTGTDRTRKDKKRLNGNGFGIGLNVAYHF